MAAYTYNPDVAHMFELEQQVRTLQREVEHLHQQLTAQRTKTHQVQNDYRVARKTWADTATEEINRSTRVYVEQIRDLTTYIAFLERHDHDHDRPEDPQRLH